MPKHSAIIPPPARKRKEVRLAAEHAAAPLPALYTRNETEEVVSFGHYLWLLRKAWWKIAIFVTACTAVMAILSVVLTPVYEATARVAIDTKRPNTVMAQNELANMSSGDADQVFNTELQLIQSDAVLRPVAENFKLQDLVHGTTPSGVNASDAPTTLKGLAVTHPANSFLIDIHYRSTNTVQAASVANAIALSYIDQSRETRVRSSMDESLFMEKQLASLKKNMQDSAARLAAYEKDLGVINSNEKTTMLEARLQQLNTDFTQAQGDRMQKEVDLQALQSGSLAAIQTSAQGAALSKLEDQVNAAQEKMESIKTIYGTANAEYKQAATTLAELTRQYKAAQQETSKRTEVQFSKAKNRETLISQALREAKAQSDKLNAHSAQYQELKREAEANKNLYGELYRKIQEASIDASFQGSAIRIVDHARPSLKPVFPNKLEFIGLGFFLSLAGSIIAVIVSDMVDKSLRDPRQTERELGVEVVGILPYVRGFKEVTPGRLRSISMLASTGKLNRSFSTVDFYDEAVNTLLSSVRLSRRGQTLRTIMVTSALQGEGKSSCIAHLAAAHARQNHRTLLIDADLRCPTLHKYFDFPEGPGLSDVIMNRTTLEELRRAVPGSGHLDVITAGVGDAYVIERIAKAVQEILTQASDKYDMVFIDAPPMLCFAEPLQLAAMTDGVLLVCKAGETPKQTVMSVFETLQRLGIDTLGVVLNKVHQKMSSEYTAYRPYYAAGDRGKYAA